MYYTNKFFYRYSLIFLNNLSYKRNRFIVSVWLNVNINMRLPVPIIFFKNYIILIALCDTSILIIYTSLLLLLLFLFQSTFKT